MPWADRTLRSAGIGTRLAWVSGGHFEIVGSIMKQTSVLILAAVLFCVLAGVLVGSSAYTFIYANGFSYMTNDPATCVNCHVMRDQYDSWHKSSHHAVATCNDCHVPHDFVGKWYTKASNGYHHSKAFTLQDFHEPIRIKPHNSLVLERNCLYCHDNLVHDIAASHRPTDGDLIGCVRCHNEVGHRLHR